jgi:DNA-binding CsgD family transcriptional regulator
VEERATIQHRKNLARELDALGGDIHGSLEELAVPMYLLDRSGRIRWLNQSGEALIPGGTGKNFTAVLAADQVHPTRRHFALRMLGRESFEDHETVLRTEDGGRHPIEISSVPLRRGRRIVGVFGVVRPADPPDARPVEVEPPPELTPRQHEVLSLLGRGLNTQQMADEMGLSVETIRNHVRSVLAQLRVQSRLEAVVAGHRLGLLDHVNNGD